MQTLLIHQMAGPSRAYRTFVGIFRFLNFADLEFSLYSSWITLQDFKHLLFTFKTAPRKSRTYIRVVWVSQTQKKKQMKNCFKITLGTAREQFESRLRTWRDLKKNNSILTSLWEIKQFTRKQMLYVLWDQILTIHMLGLMGNARILFTKTCCACHLDQLWTHDWIASFKTQCLTLMLSVN